MKAIAIILAGLISGCAVVPQRPIVDMQGVNQEQYSRDYNDCYAYASQVQDNTMAQGAITGVIGALLGASVGNHSTAKWGAGLGLLEGLGQGAAETQGKQKEVLYNCLRGRGYSVLGG